MVAEISVSDMLKKLNLEKAVEQQRKCRQINRECSVCGGQLTIEAGCLVCYSCGESSC